MIFKWLFMHLKIRHAMFGSFLLIKYVRLSMLGSVRATEKSFTFILKENKTQSDGIVYVYNVILIE